MAMTDVLLHSVTRAAVEGVINKPSHAILLIGLPGMGKPTVARHIAAQLLEISPDDLAHYPYMTFVAPMDGKAIPIDNIRSLQQFMALKIPGKRKSISRVAIIEDAHLLTTEAQNALLKTLEEPPEGTIILLTASSSEAMLPTILSRTRKITIITPPNDMLQEYFENLGHPTEHITRALMVSGGLPGLTHALLTSPKEHPLFAATAKARTLLQASAYERLSLVEELVKQKALALDTLFILGQMSKMALTKSPDMPAPAAERWQRIMRLASESEEALLHNVQAKLVLTNLMLNM